MAYLDVRRSVGSLSAILFCIVACSARLQAQTQNPSAQTNDEDLVRVETDLVQTDVMVFDKGGKFVDGLKREQFDVRVDGRPVPVVFFERFVGDLKKGATGAGASNGNAAQGEPGATRGRYVAFFLDDVHLSADSLERVRKTVRQFVENSMRLNDSVLVATATGQLGFLQQFTDNKGVLRVALSRLTYKPFIVRDAEQIEMTEYQAIRVDAGDRDAISHFAALLLAQTNAGATPVGVGPPSGGSIYSKPSGGRPIGMSREQAERMVVDRAQWMLKQTADHSLGTLGALERLMRGSAQLPGRKLIFFISDGFYLNDRNTGFADKLRQITDAALRAGVVIYSMDARGLVGDVDASSNRVDQVGKLSRANVGSLAASQDPLTALASDTGGRALLNSGQLDAAVRNALEETSNYYRIAWKPETDESKGGKFSKVEVEVVGRPELTVRLPKGYMASLAAGAAGDAKAAPRANASGEKLKDLKDAGSELRAALTAPVVRRALPVTLSTSFVDVPGTGTVVTSSVEVATDGLMYGPDGKQAAAIDVVGVVLNDQGKQAANFKTRLTVTPLPAGASGAAGERPGVIYNHRAPLAPGIYQVRAAARDAGDYQVGSAVQWIEVPDLSKRQLALSSLHLGGRAVGGAKAGEAAQVQFSVDHRFARSSRLDFLAFVYNAARASAGAPVDLSLEIQVLQGNRAVVSAPARKLMPDALADFARIPITGAVSLGQLPAGQYEIELKVNDNVAKTSATQRAIFEIQ